MSDTNVIETKGLRKTYSDFVAVDGLDLSVQKNSFTGLLGPNGAGKSTILKMLTHLINATSGNAYINGVDVAEDPSRALTGVGVVVETLEFYLYMTPRETMTYIGEILGMNSESISSQTDEIMEKVKMSEWADKKLGTFSKGMRQRVALGQALLNDPSVIILDEPTAGLDPRGMAETREVLKNLRNNTDNLTILMSSHMLYEVSDLCDRISMINYGKLILDDDIEAVMAMNNKNHMVVRSNRTPDADMMSALESLDGVESAERSGNDVNVRLKSSNGKTKEAFFKGVGALDMGVYSVCEEESLESVYLDLIKESK